MKVLVLHNRYHWPGGEDAVVRAEAELLRAHGHEVVEHVADNRNVLARGRLATLAALWRAPWSRRAYDDIRDLVRSFRPDVAHAHNLWFALSPSVLAACCEAGVSVVVTLHNFRLLCPGGVLLDADGQACDQCVEGSPWPGVRRGCYRDSRLASFLVARMIARNRKRGTWEKDVNLFLVPSEFCRDTFIRGKLPAGRIAVKPNFVADPLGGVDAEIPEFPARPRVLFVGRLSREKGLRTLLRAWSDVEKSTGAELRLVGDGPLKESLAAQAPGEAVSFAGRVPPERIPEEVAAASLLVLPSECYETFGRVVVEGYASGRPALVSRLGGPAQLVRDGETGLLFEPGNARDLAAKLTQLLGDADGLRRMGRSARAAYLAAYTPERNYDQLMEAYKRAGTTPA